VDQEQARDNVVSSFPSDQYAQHCGKHLMKAPGAYRERALAAIALHEANIPPRPASSGTQITLLVNQVINE
jgi:hypothetical protein